MDPKPCLENLQTNHYWRTLSALLTKNQIFVKFACRIVLAAEISTNHKCRDVCVFLEGLAVPGAGGVDVPGAGAVPDGLGTGAGAVADGLGAAAPAPAPELGTSARSTRSGRTVTQTSRAAQSAEQQELARLGRLLPPCAAPAEQLPPGANGAQQKRRGRPPKVPPAAHASTSSAGEQGGEGGGGLGGGGVGLGGGGQGGDAVGPSAKGIGSSAAEARAEARASFVKLDTQVKEFLAAHQQVDAVTKLLSLLCYDEAVLVRAAELCDKVRIFRTSSGEVLSNAKFLALGAQVLALRQFINLAKKHTKQT